MSFLGDIGQTFFGGSDSNQKSSESSSSNGSTASGNSAYPFLAALLGPAAQYVTGGGNSVGSVLGLPGYTPTSAPAYPTGTPSPQPVPSQTQVPAGPLTHVDLFHDGINGNGKKAQKRGQPTSYWTDSSGRPIDPNNYSAQTAAPAMGGGGLRGGLGGGADPRTLTANPMIAAMAGSAPAAAGAPTGPTPTGFNINDSGMGPAVKPTATAVPASPAATTATAPAATPALDALTNFSNSAGLKFLQDQGNNMINNNQAAKGMLQSGATAKGIEDYANNLNSTYLNQYLSHLFDFGKLGLGAAGILSDAGKYSIGSNFSSSVGKSQGQSNSKPGILPGMQAAGGQAAAAGA